MRNTKYTYNLAKGCGLLEETLALISVCDEYTTRDSLAQFVQESNFLTKCTAQRSMDIVKLVFYPRFMKNNAKVPLWLKSIREKGLMLSQFKQLLMIYCARENAVFYDYLKDVLYPLKQDGFSRIPEKSTLNFVENIVKDGKAEWGESAVKRNSSYIKAAMMDFDIMNRREDILPYEIAPFTVLYLMHELHFEGLSDINIWNHDDWLLFGLDKYAVQQRIMEQNIRGGYIAQATGDLMTISWNYKSMEEMINAQL